MIAMSDIQTFAEKVAKEFHPERIILFGSYACGEATPDSDVDLLVIMSFKGKGFRQSSKISLRVDAPFPMDLLCRTPAMIRKRLAMGDSFMREVIAKGRVLYEAHHG
jgi:predicted nucleotidyltransferase